MKVYSFSEARQQLAELLSRARREGQVEIRRRNGEAFVVRPAGTSGSPLDVPAVRTGLSREEIVGLVRESRRSSGRFLTLTAPPGQRIHPKRQMRAGAERQPRGVTVDGRRR